MSEERAPEDFMEIFLQPGEFYFSDADTRLRTLLGSCVSITMWHPQRRLGGMCHYLLPTRSSRDEAVIEGRYGDEALFLLLREARQAGCRPHEFVYKVFGGARMTDRSGPVPERGNVGKRNIQIALDMLEDFGIQIQGEDVGGFSARSIMLDNWSGDVWVRNTYDIDPALQRDLMLSE